MTEITDKAAIERFHTIILDLLLHPAFRGKIQILYYPEHLLENGKYEWYWVK